MGNCEESPQEALMLAIEQFNNRDWFDCHETLEDIWMGETGEARQLYQGIIHISVALYHWSNGNLEGALSLLGSGTDYLTRVQPVCQQIDVSGLVSGANGVREELIRLGRNRMAELATQIIPVLNLADQKKPA
jgi:uncharacterized protein